MSSFSENFQRDENKDNTQYDDSAFYTFAISMLLVGIVILIILILRRIFYEKKFTQSNYKNCQCTNCKKRLKDYHNKIKGNHINFRFYFYIFLLIIFIYLSYLSYLNVQKNAGKIKGFNPYEILEISPNADERTIKKAYKKLALKYHPDKNPNNLQAKSKFILIAKAYDALTNEESKKNFEKYGNPDGPGSMRISVALPSFVLEKKNHMPILVLFVILILVICPVAFLMWYHGNKEYNDTGMMISDQFIFYNYLNENILLKQMPFVLGLAREYLSLSVKADETDILIKAYNKYLSLMSKHKLETIHPLNKKAICLLYSYLDRNPLKYANYEKDLNTVLNPTSIFIENMYKMCIEFTQIHTFRKEIKNFGYDCVNTIFEFSQNITQQISHIQDHFNAFYQLPYFTENKIKLLKRKFGKVFNNKPTVFNDFLLMDEKQRNEILDTEFSSQEIDDINKALESLPVYEAKMEVFTEGFEDILVDDYVTFKLILERKNLEEGKNLGVNHSNSYPILFNEQVSMNILMEKNIIFQNVLDIKERITINTNQHPVREIGKFKFTCELIPLNYKGLNQTFNFEVNVVKNSEKRKEHLQQIQKREVKKIEPSYFQQLLNQVIPLQNDDSDEEEEDENDDKSKDKKEEGNKEEKENDKNQEKESEDVDKTEHEKNE